MHRTTLATARRVARRRLAAGIGVLSLLAALTACSGSGSSPLPSSSGPATASAGGVAKGVAPDTSTPSSAPTSPPAATTPSTTAPSTTAPSTTAPAPRPVHAPGLRDFADVTYSVPSGFEQSGDYRPLTPLEADYVSHFVVPISSSNSKEVIGMYVYTLPPAKAITARTDPVTLIKGYNARTKAVVSGSIRKAASTIDGLTAYTETATEPGGYTYIAYWAFGVHHFLQFSCQLGSASGVATLAVACGTALASLRVD